MSDTATLEISDEQMAAHLADWEAQGPQIPEEKPEPTADAQAEDLDTQANEPGDGQSPEEEPAEAGTESEEKPEDAKPEQTEKPEAEKQPQTKAEKEAARQDKSWKKLNEEREAVKREREALEAQKAELALKAARKPEPLKDDKGFTADDYEKYADAIEKEGDHPQSTIELARLKARQLRDKEQYQQAESHRQAVDLVIKQTIEKYPDLKTPDSPIAKAMQAIHEQEKADAFYTQRPDGIARMAELAAARVKADSVPALEKRNSELTKEVARLTKLVSPSKGGTAAIGKVGNNADPSEAEVEAIMKELDSKGTLIG